MGKGFKKFFKEIKPTEPPPELFDRIILAIKREQELQKTKRLLFCFLFLSVVSLVTTSFSLRMLVSQAKNSGILYFISTAISDFGTFLTFWKDFSLAILEILPINEIIIFSMSFLVCVFTLRLFLQKKGLIFKGLVNKLSTI